MLVKETVLYGGNKVVNNLDQLDIENCPVFLDNEMLSVAEEEEEECQNFIRIKRG